MATKIETFLRHFLKTDLPDVRPGDTIRVYQKMKKTLKKGKPSMGQEGKEKSQIFEGIVIARKHGKEMGATITVRKVISGVGVEKIFPIHSPTIEKIEILKRGKVRRAKLYYLREAKGKKARLKKREFAKVVTPSYAPASTGSTADKEAPKNKEEIPEEEITEASSELKPETEKEK